MKVQRSLYPLAKRRPGGQRLGGSDGTCPSKAPTGLAPDAVQPATIVLRILVVGDWQLLDTTLMNEQETSYPATRVPDLHTIGVSTKFPSHIHAGTDRRQALTRECAIDQPAPRNVSLFRVSDSRPVYPSACGRRSSVRGVTHLPGVERDARYWYCARAITRSLVGRSATAVYANRSLGSSSMS